MASCQQQLTLLYLHLNLSSICINIGIRICLLTTTDIRKSFNQSPTSLRLELGSRAELRCEPPGGFPEPKLTWHKNNAVITSDSEPGISVSGGTLTFRQVALQHMANYSCSAENIAGRRVSDSAVLIVYGECGPWTVSFKGL